MKQSFSYYITLFVLKLKGVKKDFSQDPIDYKKIRKEDVHHPKGQFFKQENVRNFKISNSSITEIGQNIESEELTLIIHGGAFICGPAKHHWDSTKAIAKGTKQTIWMCNYPKAPENKISAINKNIDAIYEEALQKYQANKITLIGDSVGATLITTLMQRCVKNVSELPKKIILVSPVMDASLSNPAIEKLETTDPMLAKKGVLSAKRLCAENDDLKSSQISPIYGSFENFPVTILYIAENDITYPDQKLAVEKLNQANVQTKVVEGKNMPHIWPFLPVMKEAKLALKEIIKELNS